MAKFLERITMYNRTSTKGDTLRGRLRLIDGRDVTLNHISEILDTSDITDGDFDF